MKILPIEKVFDFYTVAIDTPGTIDYHENIANALNTLYVIDAFKHILIEGDEG